MFLGGKDDVAVGRGGGGGGVCEASGGVWNGLSSPLGHVLFAWKHRAEAAVLPAVCAGARRGGSGLDGSVQADEAAERM